MRAYPSWGSGGWYSDWKRLRTSSPNSGVLIVGWSVPETQYKTSYRRAYRREYTNVLQGAMRTPRWIIRSLSKEP